MVKTIYFTRHALSCNNIIKNPLSKNIDPSITIDGIERALEKSYNSHKNVNFRGVRNNPNVFVSCLCRTWMTYNISTFIFSCSEF